ncbi:MAG: DUF1353 domain-containing protein [Rhizobiaceae bacterium]
MKRQITAAPTLLVSVALTAIAHAQSFDGAFDFRWLSDPQDRHRIMRLLSDVSFTDSAGKVWTVPAGADIDGASIPRWLWTYAGSPFVGNYRRASVIHDYFCETSSSGGNDVHKMFKEAMIADGVSLAGAWSKYLAVLGYGNTAGKCGKRVAAIEEYRKGSLDQDFPLPDEALALFARIQAEVDARELVSERDSDRFREYANSVLAIAPVKAALTYRAAVEFRLMPSPETLKDVEVAIAEEQLGDDEIEQAMLLAVATVPEPLP